MKNKYNELLSPFYIGSLKIKNRVVMCAMTGTALIEKNQFNEPTREFYIERAKGGVGLIVAGASMVQDMWGRGLWLNEAKDIFDGPVKETVEEIHKYGTKIFMQIGAGLGRVLNLNVIDMIPDSNADAATFASSELPNYWKPTVTHREMTIPEIEKIVDSIADSAKLAKDAGIDGVEIHAVHEGYLLDQFAITNMNKRNDQYGGSLENRLRFACDIVKAIKKKCGQDYPVIMRYSVASKMKGFKSGALPGEDYVEFGRSMEESPSVAKMLEEAGYDALNADNGSYDSWYWAHPPMYMPKACNLPECTYIKDFVSIPVICAGRMDDPDIANDAIKNKKIDGIGIARQLLADPYWVKKIQNKNTEDILPCIACHNGCLGSLLNKKGTSCALNPAAMHEQEYAIKPAEKIKKVLIAGGGIGGMESARLLHLRGHEVLLMEKTDKLGGVFNAAAAPDFKESDKDLINWYYRQMENIDVRLNTEVTAEIIKAENPDFVIIATGATPKKLKIFDSTDPNIITATETLLEEKPIGNNVAVIGGGLSGCEIAYDLATKGKNVTVVEMLDNILDIKGLCEANRNMLIDLMKLHDVKIETSSRVESYIDKKLIVSKGDSKKVLNIDTVVLATGYDPDSSIKKCIDNSNDYKVIGDANYVGSLLDVIKQAYDVALNI